MEEGGGGGGDLPPHPPQRYCMLPGLDWSPRPLCAGYHLVVSDGRCGLPLSEERGGETGKREGEGETDRQRRGKNGGSTKEKVQERRGLECCQPAWRE